MKTYIPIPADRPVRIVGEQATHFRVSVDYSKGGINYFTYKTDPRGYYIYVSPVVREDGFERSALTGDGSGFKFLLKPATRLHRKTLDHIADVVKTQLDTLTEPLLAADRAAVLDALTVLQTRVVA
jgi:hypothetical protein